MPYEISEKAKNEMLHLYVDGAERHGVNQAERYYAGLITQFEILALNPRLYHERNEIKPPVHVLPLRRSCHYLQSH
jgi:toxin ParE1/3/4